MTVPLRILVVVTRPEATVEARIMDNIIGALGTAGITHEVFRARRIADIRFRKQLAQCDIVLLHTPLLLSFVYALMARYWHQKPIVGIVWDSYPVTLGGIRYDRSLRRRILDSIENKAVKLCKRILVPSADFLEESRFSTAQVVGLWHPLNLPLVDHGFEIEDAPTPLRILFAGQINATRGLEAAVARLDQVTCGRFHLKVASSNPLPAKLADHPKIEHLGYLDRATLHRVAAECDCGLVSLARDFDGPGLPSKSFEYLEAGLPCLYYGKRLEHYLHALERSGAGIDIGAETLDALDRTDVLRLKQEIVAAASAFTATFELDSPSLIDHLIEAKV